MRLPVVPALLSSPRRGRRHKAWGFSPRKGAYQSPEAPKGLRQPTSWTNCLRANSRFSERTQSYILYQEHHTATDAASLLLFDRGHLWPQLSPTCSYHIVYSTKDRIPLIDGDLREPLYEYIGGIIRGERGILLEIGGVPDHVHLLAKFKTDIAVSMMVQKIKGNSSGWVNAPNGSPPIFRKPRRGVGSFASAR